MGPVIISLFSFEKGSLRLSNAAGPHPLKGNPGDKVAKNARRFCRGLYSAPPGSPIQKLPGWSGLADSAPVVLGCLPARTAGCSLRIGRVQFFNLRAAFEFGEFFRHRLPEMVEVAVSHGFVALN